MDIKAIHCFLVHPAKNEDSPPDIGGTSVPRKGKLFVMLKGIFDKSHQDCRIDISFNHGPNGEQQNECRDLLMAYAGSHSIDDGRKLAVRLQGVTTQKSGLGLLFLMAGQDSTGRAKIVLSRFPADQGILAEEKKDSLTVEFLEKVFMKSATSYKAAAYEGKPGAAAFWAGRAVDKQINTPGDHLAHYWIKSFLSSDLKTTSATGTKRLAVAIQAALKKGDPDTKAKITAAVTLAAGLNGKTTSVQGFCEHFGLADIAGTAIQSELSHESLATEQFRFDVEEFQRNIPYRTMELSNGGMLTAAANKFDDVFKSKPVANAPGEVQITTRGRVVDQRLRKGRL